MVPAASIEVPETEVTAALVQIGPLIVGANATLFIVDVTEPVDGQRLVAVLIAMTDKVSHSRLVRDKLPIVHAPNAPVVAVPICVPFEYKYMETPATLSGAVTEPEIDVEVVNIGVVVKVGFPVGVPPPTQIQIPEDSHFKGSVAVTLYAPFIKHAAPAALKFVLGPLSTHFHKKFSVLGDKVLGKVVTVINPPAFQTVPAVGTAAIVFVPWYTFILDPTTGAIP